MSADTLWKSIERIEGLSVQTGLDRVGGQQDAYKTLLQMVTKEIEKCDKNLKKFLADGNMSDFRIEVHGIKGSLANIGAMELSARALELETASKEENADFCAANLPAFLETLQGFNTSIAEVFAGENENHGNITLPAELPPIFKKLTAAFGAMDFPAIDAEIDNLDALNTDSPLKEKIEKIKDAVLTMDYESAIAIMRELQGS